MREKSLNNRPWLMDEDKKYLVTSITEMRRYMTVDAMDVLIFKLLRGSRSRRDGWTKFAHFQFQGLWNRINPFHHPLTCK